jgi:hypothetical protein
MKRSAFPAFLILISGYAGAQQTVTNSGNLQIHSNGILSVFGNFNNSATATLINNGGLYIKANISNDQSSMNPGTGAVHFNGTSAQSLNGLATFKVYDLNTNNTNGITLNNNLSVSRNHTFSNGLIHTSVTPNYLVYESGSSYSGNNDSRHVTGWVKKIGNSDFTFPVGNLSSERAIRISALSATAEFNCHYRSNTNNLFNLSPPLVEVHDLEYWQLNKVSGSTARVTLNWDQSKLRFNNVLLSDVRTAYYTSGTWTNGGGTATGNVSTTGSITSNTLSSFGEITFGFTAYPVPVKLISFTGERKDETTFLRWVAENEENLDRYEVQRSKDPTGFTTIGKRLARNLGTRQYYDFEDRSVISGIVYYRLKIFDLDGTISYSRTIAVSEAASQHGFAVVNPARKVITIFNRTGKEGLFAYKLINAAGQEVMKGTITMGTDQNAILALPPYVSAGVYLLEIANKEILFREKLLVGN